MLKTARQRLAFKIAEQITCSNIMYDGYTDCNVPVDVDAVYEIINCMLPSTYEEIQQEIEEWERLEGIEPVQPTGPSLLTRLREAVHADKGTPLKVVMEAAIKICNEVNHDKSLH